MVGGAGVAARPIFFGPAQPVRVKLSGRAQLSPWKVLEAWPAHMTVYDMGGPSSGQAHWLNGLGKTSRPGKSSGPSFLFLLNL